MKRILFITTVLSILSLISCQQNKTADDFFDSVNRIYTADSLKTHIESPQLCWLIYDDGMKVVDSLLSDSTSSEVSINFYKQNNYPISQDLFDNINKTKRMNYIAYEMEQKSLDTAIINGGYFYFEYNRKGDKFLKFKTNDNRKK